MKQFIGRTIKSIETKPPKELRVPDEVIITFTDDSSITITTDCFCGIFKSFLVIGEFEIINIDEGR